MGFRRRSPLTGSALSSTLARWTQPGLVMSIQRGTVTIAAAATSGTATITAVDLTTTRLRFLGSITTDSADSGTNPETYYVRIALTNGTTITATRDTADGTYGRVVRFEVTQYYPGVIKRVQRDIVTVSAGTSGTTTITTANTLKTEIDYLGHTMHANATTANVMGADVAITNATTVTATIGNVASVPVVIGFQATEFY